MSADRTVALARVHGRDRQGPRDTALGALHNVTCVLQPGVHGFVGTPADGTAALCDLGAGHVRPRIGAVTVAGSDPAAEPAMRRRIGALLARPSLPSVGTVRNTASRLGREMDGVLEELGASRLAERSLRSLAPPEQRLVELSWALSCPEPAALWIHEPYATVAEHDREALQARLRAAGEAGACVVVTSADPGALVGWVDATYLLDAGSLVTDDGGGWAREGAAELTVWLDPPEAARSFAAGLLRRQEAVDVRWHRDGTVVLRASDLAAAGRIAATETAEGDAPVRALRATPPDRASLLAEARRRAAERAEQARLAARLEPLGGSEGEEALPERSAVSPEPAAALVPTQAGALPEAAPEPEAAPASPAPEEPSTGVTDESAVSPAPSRASVPTRSEPSSQRASAPADGEPADETSGGDRADVPRGET